MKFIVDLAKRVFVKILLLIIRLYIHAKDLYFFACGQHKIAVKRKGQLAPIPSAKRAAVVAIYPDENSLPFIENLLCGLKENDFFVLLISTKHLDEAASKALLPHCHLLIERSQIGRDFGSYDMGLAWLKQQPFFANLETLALINDSLFFPKNISETIKEMLAADANWMSLFENFEYHYHSQSFFQIFRSPVFRSKNFDDFWTHYTTFSSRHHSINKGEVGLTEALKKGGYLPDVRYGSTRIWQSLSEKLVTREDSCHLNKIVSRTLEIVFPSLRNHLNIVTSKNSEQNEDLEQMISEICSAVSWLAENKNPTHSVGLLCNYLFGAPIKRDICVRRNHTHAEVVAYAKGFEKNEIESMAKDLRFKGNKISMAGHPYQKLMSLC